MLSAGDKDTILTLTFKAVGVMPEKKADDNTTTSAGPVVLRHIFCSFALDHFSDPS
jgi:hypothetical protein